MFGPTRRQLVRQHERERAEWTRERERLLNHILLLAGKPQLEPPPGVRVPDQPEEDPILVTVPDLIP